MLFNTEDVDKIGRYLTHIHYDSSEIADEVVDEELVAWYEKRFDMFVEDKCRGAIDVYLRKLQFSDCNERTKLTIMYMALNK
jgi:hypothetical protein